MFTYVFQLLSLLTYIFSLIIIYFHVIWIMNIVFSITTNDYMNWFILVEVNYIVLHNSYINELYSLLNKWFFLFSIYILWIYLLFLFYLVIPNSEDIIIMYLLQSILFLTKSNKLYVIEILSLKTFAYLQLINLLIRTCLNSFAVDFINITSKHVLIFNMNIYMIFNYILFFK